MRLVLEVLEVQMKVKICRAWSCRVLESSQVWVEEQRQRRTGDSEENGNGGLAPGKNEQPAGFERR